MKNKINKIVIIAMLISSLNIFCDTSITEAPIFAGDKNDFDNPKKLANKSLQVGEKSAEPIKGKQILQGKNDKNTINICQPYCYDIEKGGNIKPSYPSHLTFKVKTEAACNVQNAKINNVCPKENSYIDEKRLEFKKDVVDNFIPLKNLDVQFNAIYFLPWSSQIKNPDALEKNAIKALKILNMHPNVKVLLIGRAANVNNEDQDADLYVLSLQRANAIKSYLVRQGIPEEKIIVTGIGFQKTINSSKEVNLDNDRETVMYITI